VTKIFVYSHAYAFYAASVLKGDLKRIHDSIEDVVAQADEVDEKYLQVCTHSLTRIV
jgi:hypothetical protein